MPRASPRAPGSTSICGPRPTEFHFNIAPSHKSTYIRRKVRIASSCSPSTTFLEVASIIDLPQDAVLGSVFPCHHVRLEQFFQLLRGFARGGDEFRLVFFDGVLLEQRGLVVLTEAF